MHVDSGGGGTDLDFELNLAPIIDCFTVLITFLLVSASYVSLQIIEASVASVEVTQSTDPAPVTGVSLTVMVKLDGSYDILVSGEDNQVIPIPATPGALELVDAKLTELLQKWKETSTVTVSGEENVEYHSIVQVMEACRKHFKTILMGGF